MTFILQYILAFIIIFFERNRKRSQLIDIMTIFNVIYLLCFVVTPVTAYFMLKDIHSKFSYDRYSVFYFVTGGNYDFTSSNFFITGFLSILLFLIFISSY